MSDVSLPWDGVIGQHQAVSLLQSAIGAPVHAYLFLGPEGAGKRECARIFTAGLLSDGFAAPDAERVMRLAEAEQLADLVVIEPEGRQLLAGDARRAIYEAGQPPVEQRRRVVMIDRFHTATPEAAASLLKVVEEPPAATIMVLLAQEVPKEHVTIASRCVTVPFSSLRPEDICSWLVAEGLADESRAEVLAGAARGNQRRARLLAADDGFALRHSFWQQVPARCGTTGADACALTSELQGMLEEALKPVVAEHDKQIAEEKEMEEHFHIRVGDRKAREARQRRELRHFREEELRWGFSVLAETYRDDLGYSSTTSEVMERLRAIQAELVRNPNETLMLQNLFRNLPRAR